MRLQPTNRLPSAVDSRSRSPQYANSRIFSDPRPQNPRATHACRCRPFSVDSAAITLSSAARIGLYSDLLERLHVLPGVLSVSLSTRSPIDFSSQVRRIDVPGVP